MQVLDEIQKWYGLQCDGDWEHSYGVTVDTLDNPGWKLSVSLVDTLLEDVKFDVVQEGDPESKSSSWIYCYKENGFFIGMCSNGNLEMIISIFIKWAKENTDTSFWDESVKGLIEKCKTSTESPDEIIRLRKIFRDIDTIPNEHPRKKELVELFNECWKDAVSRHLK